MFSSRPETRLSMATTSSPRSRSESQRWEPRNPAPPVTTTRLPLAPAIPLLAAQADVREPAAADGGGLEQVPGVDDDRRAHEPCDGGELQPPELVPLGEHYQNVGPLARVVGVAADVDPLEHR